MFSLRLLLPAVALAASGVAPLRAQTPARGPSRARTDSTSADSAAIESDDEGVPLGLQFGIAAGALQYREGRREEVMGAVIRWAPRRWLSLSATPAGSHIQVPALSTGAATSRSGLVDVPVEATVSHAFSGSFAPTVSGGFGVTLPVGDTATGFGTGRLGYAASAGLGFTPVEQLWVHLGVGRSLSGFSVQSAFTGGSGWGDASAGVSLTERLSLSGGYSTDLGAVDSTIGRSTSVNGGVGVSLHGATTLHLNASHGLSGTAPSWSFSLGLGTAFPYLGHLGDGSMDQLRQTFGGGTHGLGNGSGGSRPTGRGRGRP